MSPQDRVHEALSSEVRVSISKKERGCQLVGNTVPRTTGWAPQELEEAKVHRIIDFVLSQHSLA
jgi:hypothetical protein